MISSSNIPFQVLWIAITLLLAGAYRSYAGGHVPPPITGDTARNAVEAAGSVTANVLTGKTASGRFKGTASDWASNRISVRLAPTAGGYKSVVNLLYVEPEIDLCNERLKGARPLFEPHPKLNFDSGRFDGTQAALTGKQCWRLKTVTSLIEPVYSRNYVNEFKTGVTRYWRPAAERGGFQGQT